MRPVVSFGPSALVLKYARCPVLDSTVQGMLNSNIALVGTNATITSTISGCLEQGNVSGSNRGRNRRECCIDSGPSSFMERTSVLINHRISKDGILGISIGGL